MIINYSAGKGANMIRLLSAALLLSTALTTAVPAMAQQAASLAAPPVPDVEDAGGGDRADIIVVGQSDTAAALPGSASVVDSDELARSRSFTVLEALRQVPGVFARDEEGAGIRPNIGIRGLSPIRSTKVLLLEDGIAFGFAPYGDNAAYFHPPLSRFERIEVLRGAAQIRFGPQTIGGVVNYITPDAPAELSGRLGFSGGNRGYRELDGMLGGPAFGGRLLGHANYRVTDGNRANQRLRVADFYGKGEWDLAAAGDLELRLSHTREDSQVSYTGLTRAEFAADPRGNIFANDEFTTRRWSAVLAHGVDIGDWGTLRTNAYYHRFHRIWARQSSNSAQRPNDASDPLCGNIANLNTTCGNEVRDRTYDTFGVESRLTIDHGGDAGSTEVGMRWHREEQRRVQINSDTPTGRLPGTSVNAGLRENNQRFVEAFAVFAQSDIRFGPIGVQPGFRAEFIDYRRENLGTSILVGGRPTGALTTPTEGRSNLQSILPGIGATWQLAPTLTLYGGVHRGFAPPRVEDIITATGGSVDLDAERSWNSELGLRGRLVAGFNFDLTAFNLDFSNQIIPASVAGGVGATLTSAGRTRHRGGELSLNYSSRDAGVTSDTDIFARAALTWVAEAAFASTRIATAPCFDGRVTGAPVAARGGDIPCGIARDVRGNRLPYAPEWLYSAAVGVERGWFTAQAEVQGQSSLYADDANLITVSPDGQRGRVNGWTVVNLTLNIHPEGSPVSGFVAVKNLFDTLYITDRARGILVGTPQLVQAGVSWRF
jgi:Fe(3+) dicitrate transport protein